MPDTVYIPHYANLFKGDNNLNNPEVILAIPYDGINTQSYGGSTFLVNSSCANSTYSAGSSRLLYDEYLPIMECQAEDGPEIEVQQPFPALFPTS